MKCSILSFLLFLGMGAISAAKDSAWPFESIVRRGNTIVGIVSRESGGWDFVRGDTSTGIIEPGASLVIPRGSSVTLFSHMASFTITARFSPRPVGLQVVHTYRKGVSREDETHRYFIPAH